MSDSSSVEYEVTFFSLNNEKKDEDQKWNDDLPERIKNRPINDPRADVNVKITLRVKNEPKNVVEYELRCHLVTTNVGDRLILSQNTLQTDKTKNRNFKPLIRRIEVDNKQADSSTNLRIYGFFLDFGIASVLQKEVKSILKEKYEAAEALYEKEELCKEEDRFIDNRKREREVNKTYEKKASSFFKDINNRSKLFLAVDVYQKHSNGKLVRVVRKYSDEIIDENALNINVLCTIHVPTKSADMRGTKVFLLVRDIKFPYKMVLRIENAEAIVIEPLTVVPAHSALSYMVPDYPNQNETRKLHIPCTVQLISDSGRSASGVIELYYVNSVIPPLISYPNPINQGLIGQATDQYVESQRQVEVSFSLGGESISLTPVTLSNQISEVQAEVNASESSENTSMSVDESAKCASQYLTIFGNQLQQQESITAQSSTEGHQQFLINGSTPVGFAATIEYHSANMQATTSQGFFHQEQAASTSSFSQPNCHNEETEELQKLLDGMLEEQGCTDMSVEFSFDDYVYFDNSVDQDKQPPKVGPCKNNIESYVFKYLTILKKLINKKTLTAVEIMNIITMMDRAFMARWGTDKSLLECAIQYDEFYRLDLMLFKKIKDERILNDVRHRIGSLCNRRGETLLHAVCRHNKSDFIRTLLDMRADTILAQNLVGDTPMHLAIKQDSREVIDELSKLKIFREATQLTALADMHNFDGRTVLHLAIEKNYAQLVEMLLQHYADHNKDACKSRVLGSGDTLLHLALDLPKPASTAMVRLIKEYFEEAEEFTNYAGYNAYGVYKDNEDGSDVAKDDDEYDQEVDRDDDADRENINGIDKPMQQAQISEKPVIV